MEKKEIYKELNLIFGDILNKKDIDLNDSSSPEEIEGWDSFAHINILSAIQSHYHIVFSISEIVQLKNVKDIVELIQSKTN